MRALKVQVPEQFIDCFQSVIRHSAPFPPLLPNSYYGIPGNTRRTQPVQHRPSGILPAEARIWCNPSELAPFFCVLTNHFV